MFTLSKPTQTVATVAVTVVSIVGAVLTAIFSVGPTVLGQAFDFSHNPLGAIIACLTIFIAIAGAIQAGAGRSFIQKVDGMTTVEVPLHSQVNVTPPQVAASPQASAPLGAHIGELGN